MFLRKRFLMVAAAAAFGLAKVAAPDCNPTPCNKTPQSHVIEVTSAGVSCKDAHVKKIHTIKWCAPEGHSLSIVFAPPTPFPNLTCKQPNVCMSGAVDSNAKYGMYAYRAFFDGTPVDPNVIIDQ